MLLKINLEKSEESPKQEIVAEVAGYGTYTGVKEWLLKNPVHIILEEYFIAPNRVTLNIYENKKGILFVVLGEDEPSLQLEVISVEETDDFPIPYLIKS